jgi:hypothetical protein
MCEIGFVCKQNVINHLWCSINWTAEYQSVMTPASLTCWMRWIWHWSSFPDFHAQNTDEQELAEYKQVCRLHYTTRDNLFLLLRILLYLTSSTHVHAGTGAIFSQVLHTPELLQKRLMCICHLSLKITSGSGSCITVLMSWNILYILYCLKVSVCPSSLCLCRFTCHWFGQSAFDFFHTKVTLNNAGVWTQNTFQFINCN